MTRKPTMLDVADHLGIHEATVSRALTRPDRVSATTRDRVRAAVAELGYVPHLAARQLAGGRTGTIAVIVPDLSNPYFASIAKAIQRESTASGGRVVVADSDLRPDVEIGAVRSLTPNVDGIIVCTPVSPTRQILDAVAGTPMVFVNRTSRLVSSVTVDQREIVRLGVEHLRSLGHRRIGYVDGPASYWSAAQRRRFADREGLVVIGPVAPTVIGGNEALAAVLDSSVTAVLAFNDLIAIGLTHAATRAGLSVPDDLSIVGSDDVTTAELMHPALTSVTSGPETIGAEAVALVHAAIADVEHVVDRSLTPQLQVRASTTRATSGK